MLHIYERISQHKIVLSLNSWDHNMRMGGSLNFIVFLIPVKEGTSYHVHFKCLKDTSNKLILALIF